MNDERNDERNSGLTAPDGLEPEIMRVDVSAMAVLNRSEVEMQIEAAHRFPRSIGLFLKEAKTLATQSPEIAASCIYALPRGQDEDGNQKLITGPSVRLAEIVVSAYGNMHAGARVLDPDERTITAQGVAWDIQKNVRVVIEARRRITNKKGRRFNDDMIVVTGNAAASIGFRNAVFRVVPRAYVMEVLAAARLVAVGDASTLPDKRAKLLERFKILGISIDRVLARIEKSAVEDIGLNEIELLIGIGTAIKGDPSRLEEFFPTAATKETAGGSKESGPAPGSLEEQLRAQATATITSANAARQAVDPASSKESDKGA